MSSLLVICLILGAFVFGYFIGVKQRVVAVKKPNKEKKSPETSPTFGNEFEEFTKGA